MFRFTLRAPCSRWRIFFQRSLLENLNWNWIVEMEFFSIKHRFIGKDDFHSFFIWLCSSLSYPSFDLKASQLIRKAFSVNFEKFASKYRLFYAKDSINVWLKLTFEHWCVQFWLKYKVTINDIRTPIVVCMVICHHWNISVQSFRLMVIVKISECPAEAHCKKLTPRAFNLLEFIQHIHTVPLSSRIPSSVEEIILQAKKMLKVFEQSNGMLTNQKQEIIKSSELFVTSSRTHLRCGWKRKVQRHFMRERIWQPEWCGLQLLQRKLRCGLFSVCNKVVTVR